MRGVAFDRLDEIGNEIGAALQLRFDAAPAFGDDIAPAHETVERRDAPEADENGKPEKNVSDHESEISGLTAVRPWAPTPCAQVPAATAARDHRQGRARTRPARRRAPTWRRR